MFSPIVYPKCILISVFIFKTMNYLDASLGKKNCVPVTLLNFKLDILSKYYSDDLKNKSNVKKDYTNQVCTSNFLKQ